MAEHHPDTTHLRDVTADHAQAFVRHLTGRGLSGGRVNKHTTFLRAAFRVLGPAGRVKENPFAKISARDHETESRRAFTIDQLRIIIERATGSLQTLLMLGTFTGLRFGDCCTLRWDEVNLTTRIITRHPNKTRRRKHEPVVLGVPEVLARHLEALPRKGPFVVPDHARAYPAQAPILSRRIQAHLTACGITTTAPGTGGETGKRAVTWYGFHSLRHTYVSMHAAAGTPQAVMMKLAGHGSPAMSQHYTHLSAETARQTAAALPAILGPASPEARAPLPGWAVEAVKRCRTIKEVRAALGVE
jgi:integrase